MNVILMTILLTLLGAGITVLLVWLCVVSWKSIKYKKTSLNKIENLEDSVSTEVSNLYHEMETKEKEIYNNIDVFRSDMFIESKETCNEIQKINDELNKRIDDLEKKIDSRFDKIYLIIKGLEEKK